MFYLLKNNYNVHVHVLADFRSHVSVVWTCIIQTKLFITVMQGKVL